MSTVLRKAIDLVAAGAVQLLDRSAVVHSTSGRTYLVEALGPGRFRCNCQWAQEHPASEAVCSHVLAAVYVWHVRQAGTADGPRLADAVGATSAFLREVAAFTAAEPAGAAFSARLAAAAELLDELLLAGGPKVKPLVGPANHAARGGV